MVVKLIVFSWVKEKRKIFLYIFIFTVKPIVGPKEANPFQLGSKLEELLMTTN